MNVSVAKSCFLFAFFVSCTLVNSSYGSVEGIIKKAAQSIAKELQEQQIMTVRVKVDDLDVLPSSLPNAIREVLVRELEASGITVAKGTAPRILKILPAIDLPSGSGNANDDSTGQISLAFTLLDGSGKELRSLAVECNINDPVDITQITGVTADGSNTQTGQSRPVAPDRALPKADGGTPEIKPYVDSKAIRGHKDGMFAMQILKGGVPLDIQETGTNQAFCPLVNGDEYQVRIVNDAVFPVLVALTIDGIDSGWFSTHKKVLWFVPGKSSSVIEGWIKSVGDGGKGGRFKVAPEDESVAATLGSIGEVGVVQASFFRAYSTDEAKDPIDRGRSGTGLGDEFPWKTIVVKDKIPGKALRASISLRYSKN